MILVDQKCLKSGLCKFVVEYDLRGLVVLTGLSHLQPLLTYLLNRKQNKFYLTIARSSIHKMLIRKRNCIIALKDVNNVLID